MQPIFDVIINIAICAIAFSIVYVFASEVCHRIYRVVRLSRLHCPNCGFAYGLAAAVKAEGLSVSWTGETFDGPRWMQPPRGWVRPVEWPVLCGQCGGRWHFHPHTGTIRANSA
jgi:hypothetical protein